MRFSYVAVGAAGLLTSTMVDGRVVPAWESTLRPTLHARSDSYASSGNLPYSSQVATTPTPSTGRATQATTPSGSSGSDMKSMMSPSVVSATETEPIITSDKQTAIKQYLPTASTGKTDNTPITSITRPASNDQSTPITAPKDVPSSPSVVSATETKPIAISDKQTAQYLPTASTSKTDSIPITPVARPASNDQSTPIKAPKDISSSPSVVSSTDTKPIASGDKQVATTDYHPTASTAKPDNTPIISVARPVSNEQSLPITATKDVSSGTGVATSPSYTSGQIVGFKAGLNIHTSTGSSQPAVPTNLLTQDATFNQGVHAGFEAGHAAQKAAPSGSSSGYTQGQLAGFQTAVAQHQQAGSNLDKSLSSILNGGQEFNSGVKSGFQAGLSTTGNVKQTVPATAVDATVRSTVGGSQQPAVSVQYGSIPAQIAQVGVAQPAGTSGVLAASSVPAGAQVKSDVGLTASKQVAGTAQPAGVAGSVEKVTTSRQSYTN